MSEIEAYCSRCGEIGHYASKCPELGKASSSVERVKRWRERNREKYNEYQRDYMKRRRHGG